MTEETTQPDGDYHVNFEIAGPVAIFARPDTGATPISYPVPTYSAARGMFEAVLRRPHMYIHPTHVETCRPIRYERYVTNYGGPLRKPSQINGGNSYQLIATILVDVCFRIHGQVRAKQSSTRGKGRTQVRRRRGRDWRPEMTRLFKSRLIAGQTFYTPCLGWKEFVPNYFGPLRDGTGPDPNVNIVIPSFLYSMWEHHQLNPVYHQNVAIRGGVLRYEQEGVLRAQ